MIRIIFLFSFLIALSLSWLTGAGLYLHYRIGWENLLTLNPSDLAIYICAAVAPVAIIWLITGFIHHMFAARRQNNLSAALLNQARRSSEHTEALVKAMIEIQDQTRSGVLLHNISVAINHLNEIMSQIAMRFGILTSDASERLWEKAGNGNLWAFCRVIIDNADRTPNFKNALLKQSLKDRILSLAIIEFCERFQRLQYLLSNHDRERFIAGIIEEGALGKVFALIKPVMSEINLASANKNPMSPQENRNQHAFENTNENSFLTSILENKDEKSFSNQDDENKYAFFKDSFAKKEYRHENEDMFSVKANIKKIDDLDNFDTFPKKDSEYEETKPIPTDSLRTSYPLSPNPLAPNIKDDNEEKRRDFTFFGWGDNEKKSSKLPKDGI